MASNLIIYVWLILLNSLLYSKSIKLRILFILMGNNLIRGSESVDISLNHSKISRAQLITSSNHQLLRVFMHSDEATYKKWKDLTGKSNHLHHEHLLLSLDHKFISKGLCASQGEVQVIF